MTLKFCMCWYWQLSEKSSYLFRRIYFTWAPYANGQQQSSNPLRLHLQSLTFLDRLSWIAAWTCLEPFHIWGPVCSSEWQCANPDIADINTVYRNQLHIIEDNWIYNNNNIYLLQLGCYPVAVVILHVYKTWNWLLLNLSREDYMRSM